MKQGSKFEWQWLRNGKKVASINVRTESDHVILSYRQRRGSGNWERKEHSVRLDWTPCRYGGRRAWLLCPARGCGRRVAILYGGAIFASRHCYGLAYPGQRENAKFRANRRADRVRARLGGKPRIIHGEEDEPKGMHLTTFDRLRNEHEAHVARGRVSAARRLGMIEYWRGQ